MANYVIGGVIAIIIALALRKIISNKGGCDCGCSACEEKSSAQKK